MLKQTKHKLPLAKIFESTLIELPAPMNISTMWNMGSLLSMCLIMQIVTGILLAATYAPSLDQSFSLIKLFMETLDKAWLIRYIHSNGASLFFICIYIHIGRGIYYNSYLYTHTWSIGVTILLMTMATAFMGYVLPMNQMSFWGASVITNLFSEVPYIGSDLVKTIWGGPSVDSPTVTRFFTFHFVLPFVILALVMIHIMLLHSTGSSNPTGLFNPQTKTPFHLNYSFKDLMGALLTLTLFIFLATFLPLLLGDDENFIKANPSVTPHHIQPEWYFLFAYAILRSIPNKFGGVIALLLSILILYSMPFTFLAKSKSPTLYPITKSLFWLFSGTVLLLTWIGARPVEDPYILTGQILTIVYFLYYLVNPWLMKMWDQLNKI